MSNDEHVIYLSWKLFLWILWAVNSAIPALIFSVVESSGNLINDYVSFLLLWLLGLLVGILVLGFGYCLQGTKGK